MFLENGNNAMKFPWYFELSSPIHPIPREPHSHGRGRSGSTAWKWSDSWLIWFLRGPSAKASILANTLRLKFIDIFLGLFEGASECRKESVDWSSWSKNRRWLWMGWWFIDYIHVRRQFFSNVFRNADDVDLLIHVHMKCIKTKTLSVFTTEVIWKCWWNESPLSCKMFT